MRLYVSKHRHICTSADVLLCVQEVVETGYHLHTRCTVTTEYIGLLQVSESGCIIGMSAKTSTRGF